MKRTQRNRLWGSWKRDAVTCGLAVALGIGIAIHPVAAQTPMKALNGGQGVEARMTPPLSDSDRGPKKDRDTTQLTGTFSYSSRDGLELNGRPIFLTAQTLILPCLDEDELLPSPSELKGKHATVFVRPQNAGLDAVLVILDRKETDLGRIDLKSPSVEDEKWFIPSQVNPSVGEMTESAPQ